MAYLVVYIYIPCPEKNGTNNILGITLTKFNKFSQFLAQFMLTCHLTKNITKSTITTCTTPRNNDVIKMLFSREDKHQARATVECGVPGKRNTTVHFTTTVASKLARFKSGCLQRVEHPATCKRRCTKHASLISTTSNIASELQLSGPSWITLSLMQLCVSGINVFHLSACVKAGGGHFEHCF